MSEVQRPRPRKHKRRQQNSSSVIVFLLFVLLAGGLFLGRLLPGGSSLPKMLELIARSNIDPPESPDWITQDFIPLNPYSRPGDSLDRINGIVVHYVGNPGTTAAQNRSYFAGLAISGETYASSHFLIGLDGEIIQNIPLNEIAYCSNNRNDDTISIECCHPDDSGKFTPETYDSLVRLVAWLSDHYKLHQDEIIRHYDVNGKECPRWYVRHPEDWSLFLDDVKSARE